MRLSPFLIRADRLLLSLRWLKWALLHIGEHPWPHPSPDGFAGGGRVQEILERYDISRTVIFTPNRELWGDAVRLLETNPDLVRQEIDISGLLLHEQTSHGHASGNHIDGFARFLRAIAAGELTEADLTKEGGPGTYPSLKKPPDDGHGQVGPGM